MTFRTVSIILSNVAGALNNANGITVNHKPEPKVNDAYTWYSGYISAFQ